MDNRVKVINDCKFDVGLDLLNNPAGIAVRAGSFIYMTEDDVAYNISRNSAFRDRLVHLEEVKEKELLENNGVYPEDEPNFISDDELKKILAGSVKKLEEFMKTVNNDFLLNRIYELAIDGNLTMSKVKVLQKYMPNKSFIDE